MKFNILWHVLITYHRDTEVLTNKWFGKNTLLNLLTICFSSNWNN